MKRRGGGVTEDIDKSSSLSNKKRALTLGLHEEEGVGVGEKDHSSYGSCDQPLSYKQMHTRVQYRGGSRQNNISCCTEKTPSELTPST